MFQSHTSEVDLQLCPLAAGWPEKALALSECGLFIFKIGRMAVPTSWVSWIKRGHARKVFRAGPGIKGSPLEVGRRGRPAETRLGEQTSRWKEPAGHRCGKGNDPHFPLPLHFFSLSGSSWALWKPRPPWPSRSQGEYLLWGLEVGPWSRGWAGAVWGAS